MKKLAVLFCIFLVLGFTVNANPDELAELQNILQSTRGSWQAGETSFSQLNPIEQESLLGLLPGIGNMTTLPDEFISNQIVRADRYEAPHTGIRNQASCGSCYAFGACAIYESNKLVKNQGTCDLSEQDFMMKAKAIGPSGGCSGWYLDTSMDLLQNKGVTGESDCPYKAYEQSCPSGSKVKHKSNGWARTTDKETIKGALQQYGAVYVGFAVYSDFSYYQSGYYEYTSGNLRGYHAVAIVGFDNIGFKVKNSWGPGWGDQGYFSIKYNQMTNAVKFGTCFGGSYYLNQ